MTTYKSGATSIRHMLKNELNDVEIQYYSVLLQNKYLTAYGENYEDFVGDVLIRRYPGEFLPVAGGGGDNKNDGLIKSKREIFQCYAPHKYTAAKVNKKLKDDYLGAIEHWGEFFDTWVFAWCHQKAGSPDKSTNALILKLEKENGKIIKFFDFRNVLNLALEIPRVTLVAWLGSPPVLVEKLDFDLELHEIKQICETIAGSEAIADDDDDISPVPPTKLEYNRIPNKIQEYIEKGKEISGRVGNLFATDPDVLLGDRVAQKFTQEYQILRVRQEGDPAGVYWGLYDFIRHRLPSPVTPELELAAHGVLAYLFDRCNIFERPPDGWQGH